MMAPRGSLGNDSLPAQTDSTPSIALSPKSGQNGPMEPPAAPALALDYSSCEAWMDSHGALSDALGAIAFAEPSLARVSVRWAFGDAEPTLVVEHPRRSRLAPATLPLPQASSAAIQGLLPALGTEAAAALSKLFLLAAPFASSCSDRALAWSRSLDHGSDHGSLGLGSSARFDPAFPDGLDRGGPDGLAEAERVFASLAELCPPLAQAALVSGALRLSGEPRTACEALLSILEADILRSAAPHPRAAGQTEGGPPRAALPRARL